MLRMTRYLRINWLLVTVLAICVGNVVCNPAVRNLKRNIQEVIPANEEPSIDEEVLDDSSDNSVGNETIDNENTSANETVNEESAIRQPGSTNVEDEIIESGNDTAGGVFFDAADWVKEAEQWTFKGGDWGLVTLPNDKHPDVPTPLVPGPVLIAEGDSMAKVIVSRSEENVENLTLHFSYFLSNNPNNPPMLEVYQIQDDTHSERVSVETTYGEWTRSTVSLPYSGKFEIKFIGQRIVDTNEIVLDDIVLRGYYMKDYTESGYTTLEEDVYYDVEDSDTQVPNVNYQYVYGVTQTAEGGDQNVNSETQVTDNGDQTNDNETQVDDGDSQDKVNITQWTEEGDQTINKTENYNSTSNNGDNWDDIYNDIYSDDDYYKNNDDDSDNDNGWFFNNWLNNKDDNSNSTETEDSNNIFDSKGEMEVIEISDLVEDAGVGGAIIMFWTVSVLSVVLLGFLFWRRRRSGDNERTIFNRATAGPNDFDRLMYSDVPYEEANLNEKNYKSFE